MFVLFIFLSLSFAPIYSKIYERCEFINELIEVHKFSEGAAVDMSCIAAVAEFDTSKIRLETNNYNRNNHWNYGIFRLSSTHHCSVTGIGGICNINCQMFLDDDIRDDLACMMHMDTNIRTSSSARYYWHSDHIYECISERILEKCKRDNWKSTNDCLEKHPGFPSPVIFDSSTVSHEIKMMNHEFQHMAVLGWRMRNGGIKWYCSGSLITEDTILTAAHCMNTYEGGTPDVVRLGHLNLLTNDYRKEMQELQVKSIIIHPEYNNNYNDIALIKLKSKVKVTNFVIPACLWEQHNIPPKEQLETCGFGQTQNAGDTALFLRKETLTILNTAECQKSFQRKGIHDRVHLCANDKTGQQMNICEGDSGGPLEMRILLGIEEVPYIVGITSFGKECNSGGSPGIYTRVSSYVDWIRKHTPDLPTSPLECALQYRQDNMRTSFSARDPYVIKHIKGRIPNGPKIKSVIISDRYLVTSAQRIYGLSNSKIVHLDKPFSIEKVIYHPEFNIYNPYKNDVALVKLSQQISWGGLQFPVCITTNNFNNPASIIEKTYYDQVRILGLYLEDGSDLTECRKSYSSSFNFRDVDNNKILCFGADMISIPNYCGIDVGTPIYADVYHNGKSLRILRGLALFSKDCGPVIATKLSSYKDWIDKVVFKRPIK